MQSVGPDIFGFFAIVMYLVSLGALIWGLYLAYLLTRALRKYLRS